MMRDRIENRISARIWCALEHFARLSAACVGMRDLGGELSAFGNRLGETPEPGSGQDAVSAINAIISSYGG